MKDHDFEVKLLIKQNTEMAIKLQHYRRENQELALKNQDLNSWVQNLSEVFASISAAWKVFTDNEEALYTLMRKKSDSNSKLLVGKYISHFRTFDEIVNNLGEKITNQGHSESAALDAKSRISSFVNNYNLFFMQFVETYFKFNEQCINMASEKLKEPNLQAQMRQIANQSMQKSLKLKQFEDYIAKSSQNFKTYEKYNQYQLLDGVINIKNKEIEDLKERELRQTRRLQYITDYNSDNVNFILQNQDKFECFCGGAHLKYFSQFLQEKQKKQQTTQKLQTSKMVDENQQSDKQKSKLIEQLEVQKQILLQRNAQLQAKCQKFKFQNKLSDESILQSPIYIHLRSQFKDLMDYTNDLMFKINKNYEYLNQLQKLRLDEVDEIKRKYERQGNAHSKPHPQEPANLTNSLYFAKIKQRIQGYYSEIKTAYTNLSQKMKQKEDNLQQAKESLKILKKQNEDLNRKINEYQQRQMKGVENLEYRHQRFNQLQKSVNQMFKTAVQNEDLRKTKIIWGQYVQYVKTRDKKIKAMQEMLKKKDKEIQQKVKIQEVTKAAYSEVEEIYGKYKQKLDGFESFMTKTEKQIVNLSQENYRIKIELEQQKNVLSIRLKNELEVRAKLQQKVKSLQKIQDEAKAAKHLQAQIQKLFAQFTHNQKQKNNELRVELKEKQRQLQDLNELLAQKDKTIERKNLELSKIQLQNNSQADLELLRVELEEYKSKIMCHCGAERPRVVVLKTCPHIFCKKCIDDTHASRNRKCPICSVRFTKTDIHEIVWN